MSESAASHVDRLENALNSIETGAVYALAVELRDSGLTRAELLAVFDEVRARHQEDATNESMMPSSMSWT